MRHVGLGDLLERLERLRQQLAAEGLFDAARKKPLPFLPALHRAHHRQGLATPRKTCCATRSCAGRRCSSACVHAAVQGDRAAAEVIGRASATLDADPEVDVIIVARGGGDFQNLLVLQRRDARAHGRGLRHARSSARSATRPTARCSTTSPTCAPPPRRMPPSASCRMSPRSSPACSRPGRALRRRSPALVSHEIDRLEQLRSRPVLAGSALAGRLARRRADPLRRPRRRADRAHRRTRARAASPSCAASCARSRRSARSSAATRSRSCPTAPCCAARRMPRPALRSSSPSPTARLDATVGRRVRHAPRRPVDRDRGRLPPEAECADRSPTPTPTSPTLSYEQARDELVRVVTELEQGSVDPRAVARPVGARRGARPPLRGVAARREGAARRRPRGRGAQRVAQPMSTARPAHRRRARPPGDPGGDRRPQGGELAQAPRQPDHCSTSCSPSLASLASRALPRARRRAARPSIEPDRSTTSGSPPMRSPTVDEPLASPTLPTGWTANARRAAEGGRTAIVSWTIGFITPDAAVHRARAGHRRERHLGRRPARQRRARPARRPSTASTGTSTTSATPATIPATSPTRCHRRRRRAPSCCYGTATTTSSAPLAAASRPTMRPLTTSEPDDRIDAQHAPPRRRGRRWCAATSASSPASRSIRARTSSAARSSSAAQDAARRAVRLQRLAPRRRDHLRQGPRRPVRRAQRRPGHLRLGRSARSSTRSRVLNVPLILVLGHDECGAVRAAIDSEAAGCPPAAPAHRLTYRADRARRAHACVAADDAHRRAWTPSRSAASTCATPSPSCWSAPSSSATPSPRVRWLSWARTTGLLEGTRRPRHRRRRCI